MLSRWATRFWTWFWASSPTLAVLWMWNFASILEDVEGPIPKKVSSAACEEMFPLEGFDMGPGWTRIAMVMSRKLYLHEALLWEIDVEYEDLSLSATLPLSKDIM